MELPEEMKRYYERKLLESLEHGPVEFTRTMPKKKPTIKERMREWFLNKFADLYEKVRGDLNE